MVVKVSEVALGTIICDRCGKLIDTADTNKVIIYYSHCKEDNCNNLKQDRNKK
ncbi:GapA-binding peptide SR1P [Bacillus sp. ISL-40]|uniref:GapA-binding peptide SR1P n=1 Tax=unclassified Bacillus (in: firmicutes) TaxID=185979 RepID=UPI001BEC4D68|nr:GapA-binding peptide SR1P [Bacillus sp. ISL-40]MBT2740826.1 GapA-binding peptide SR1P [Bacillus sp. ISL-77]